MKNEAMLEICAYPRSVSVSPHSRFSISVVPPSLSKDLHIRALSGSKLLVERYDKKVVECIKYITECQELTREEKVMFVKKARRALGQTALMLSGGGSISMYHAGKFYSSSRMGADLQCDLSLPFEWEGEILERSLGNTEPYNGRTWPFHQHSRRPTDGVPGGRSERYPTCIA